MLGGFVPTGRIVADRDMLYLAIGILGATVMPHNLYLHSSIVQTRRFDAHARRGSARRSASRASTATIALGFAFFINAAMLILAAATFYRSGNTQVAEIQDAYPAADARCWAPPRRASSSPSRCWPRARTPPSPAPSPGRS